MFYSYLLFTYLLSGLGFLAYHFLLKEKIKPLHRKGLLYLILVVSLIAPAFLLQSPVLFGGQEVAHIEEKLETFPHSPVLDEELLACYDVVSSEEGFCHCEQLQASNLLYYKSNKFYNGMLAVKQPFFWLFFAIGGVLLINLFIKLGYLYHLKRKSETEIKVVNGKEYRLLRTKTEILAASFTLWHQYIIWNPALDELSNEEQKAVLLHEISHLKHRDTWEQIGLTFLQIFWFVNPIFYFLKKELNLLNEYIADAFALRIVGNTKNYAGLLIKLKEQQQLSYAQFFGGSALKARILEIIKPKPFLKFKFIPLIMCGVLMMMVMIGSTAAPTFNTQQLYFEEYSIIHKEHCETGKDVFCKACILEELHQHE